jgi:hypothetical protein
MSRPTSALHRIALLAAIGVASGVVPFAAHCATDQDAAKASSAGNANDKSSSGSASTTDSHPAKHAGGSGLLLIVPLEWSDQTAKKDGCGAKLYDRKNYSGDSFMMAGQQQLPSMTGPFGLNWQNRIKSIETGGKATVTIFDNRDFHDRDKVIAPGSKVPDLSAKMGFLDNFRSMKLACSA